MDRQLQSMIQLFSNLPMHTVICDDTCHVIWVSPHANKVCPIALKEGDCLADILTKQETLFSSFEQAVQTGSPMQTEMVYFDMTFDVEVNPFTLEDGSVYSIWHLLLQQEDKPVLVSAGQALELGAIYRESLFQIFNSLLPLARILDQNGLYEETQYLNMIAENCQGMLKSTINLNEYFRLNNHTQVYKPEVLDLYFEVKELVEQANFLLKRVEKKVILQAEGTTFYLRADRYKLMIILLNLLSNALEYTTPDSEIRVVLSQTERNVVLTMRDFGDGMREAVKQSAFKPFFSHAPKNNHKVGLGLYLVKELTEAQGGTVVFSSELNEGTTIILRFPKDQTGDQPTVFRSSMFDQWISDKMSPLYAFLAQHCDLHIF